MPSEIAAPDVEAAAKFLKGKKFDDWIIVKNLDEGGFGQVYLVEHRTDKTRTAALKAEPNDVEGGSAIKLEAKILNIMNEGGEKPHIPAMFQAAKHKKFCYMVMTLLGKNLKTLKNGQTGEKLSESSWLRIGIQCLYGIKLVHDYGIVHRDVKPNNFVFGHNDDPDRARLVHILDFGLSRPYASKKNDKWVIRRPRGTAEFRGTLRYVSPNVHLRKEQGRHDDLWSLYFVLIELHCGLPWQKLRDKEKVEKMKLVMPDAHVEKNMPKEVQGILSYLRSLDYYQRPNYSMFYDCLVKAMKRANVKPEDPFDWESKEDACAMVKRRTKPAAWENASNFFKSDPIGVQKPPLANNKDEGSAMGATGFGTTGE